jgi:hypothetical protein
MNQSDCRHCRLSGTEANRFTPVILAKAGIHEQGDDRTISTETGVILDSRLRGNDKNLVGPYDSQQALGQTSRDQPAQGIADEETARQIFRTHILFDGAPSLD